MRVKRLRDWLTVVFLAGICLAGGLVSVSAQDSLTAKEQALIKQIAAQQKQITDNMAKMEEAMKAIEADLNQARIYSRRGGGGAGR